MKTTKQMKRAKSNLIRTLKKKYNYKNAFRQFNNKFISPYGGYIDLVNFTNFLGLNKSIKEHFRLLNLSHRKYTDSNLFQRLLDTIILDIDRLDNADLLNNDPLLGYLEGLGSDPSPETLRRELRSCNKNNISAIETINHEFLSNSSHLQDHKEVTLLIDLTPIELYGHQQKAKSGFNHHKSNVCYQCIVASIKETQDIINMELYPGNYKPGSKEFKKIFLKTMAALPPHLKVTKIRLDSGFFSFPNIDLVVKYGLIYYIKGKINNNTPLIYLPYNIQEKDWIKVKGRNNYWISKKQVYYSPGYKKEYPVIFIREKLEDPDPKQGKLFKDVLYKYHPIFSNSPMGELNIWNFYNDGAIIELIIKELKNEFFLKNIPTARFDANNAFVKIKMLAYNILNAFKRLILKGKWITKSAKTIKNWIIRVPVIVTAFGKGIKLNMSQNIKLEHFITNMSDEIYKLACRLVT